MDGRVAPSPADVAPSPPARRPLVCVIIPTHNRASLLCRAVDSVLAQEGIGEQFDIEVLIIDDGSTDETPDVVRRRYPTLRYIRRVDNHGTSAARNAGLKEAKGQYVAFLDDDDIWLPWKLRRQVQILEARPETGVVYGQEIKRSPQDVFVWPDAGEAPSGRIVRSLLISCPVNTSSVLMRQSAAERIGLFDESLRCWEDYDFWLRLACNEQFQFLPGPAVIYQIASSGRFLSSVLSGDSAADLRKVVHAGLERLRAREHVSQAFEDDVEAGIVTRIAGQLEMLHELDAKRSYLLKALQQSPRLVQRPQLRWMLAHAPLSTDLSPSSQLGQIREFCGQIKILGAGYGLRQQLAARRLAAETWRTGAVMLAAPPHRARGLARRAALTSLSQHPGTIGTALFHILVH